MKYQIITDSCCDLTEQQYQELGVRYAPLTILYKGEPYDNFNDPAELKTFYDSMRAGETATTSAVNPEGWVNIMKPILEAGEDVLALCFSSGLSTTYQSAVIAAKELREVYPERTINVVDTLAAALGQGLLVILAARKRDQGMSLADLTAWVEDNKLHLAHWITVDDLDHLKRGGRISATTAFFGGMLNIKPIIHVDDEGHLINVAKARGRKASIEYLAKKLAEDCVDFDTVAIGHGDCPEDAAALEALLKAAGAKNVVTGYVGGVIGAHTGPGVLVVFFLGKNR
ncbi:MAG: DegV family protein [Oscillospiraceae bacterium]|nr:DegV family protein [Oscillospiraceae bacterium]